jgi:predicted RNA-binding Zn-ribbon protein involved in translation (DUF1610 family)
VTFDWRTETYLTGTCSRVGQFVRGDCACGAADVLVYDTDGDSLVCASCYRQWAHDREQKQACDKCGSEGNVWRDPVHRRNEYLCIKCHDPETLFQNRWANRVRESKPLNLGAPRAVCAARGRGSECKGEIKWRGSYKMQLCNKHAGVTGVGPNG